MPEMGLLIAVLKERYGWLTRLAAANEPVRAGVTKLRNVSRCWLGYAGDAAGDVLYSHFDGYIVRLVTCAVIDDQSLDHDPRF